ERKLAHHRLAVAGDHARHQVWLVVGKRRDFLSLLSHARLIRDGRAKHHTRDHRQRDKREKRVPPKELLEPIWRHRNSTHVGYGFSYCHSLALRTGQNISNRTGRREP